ncbi:hypothetical protein ASG71_11665 [Arthrobacter sp. Soil763]|nr:hypothetical protein ASG71_11665 [Arthrobacter sp. Soil763]
MHDPTLTSLPAMPVPQPEATPKAVGQSSPLGTVAAFNAASENLLPGTPRSEFPSKWSTSPMLEGFLGQHASTASRRIVDVYVNSTLGSIRIKAYRIGYYHGTGQRLVWTSGIVHVWRQRRPTFRPVTRMVSCPWKVTTSIDTTGWPEGFYYLVLAGASGQNHLIPLVVESASVKGKAVLVFNDCTMQAYNIWGGRSLYTGPGHSRAARGSSRSYKVSFDRPYRNFIEFEAQNVPLIRAAEAIEDVNLTLAYTTEARICGNADLVRGAAAVVFSAHSEYWSPTLRRTIEGARDRGANIVFFGANNVYWRTRLERGSTGKDRILVCYRKAHLDPVRRKHPAAVTTQWRQEPASRPESTLTGSLYGDLRSKGMFTVTDPDFFAFAGTGATRGATYAGLTGGETDRVYPTSEYPGFKYPEDLHIFAHSPESGGHTRHGWSDSTFYTVPSGAGVLNMGTMNWLQAQVDAAVPARSRAFARRVTQNIIRKASLGPLGAPPKSRERPQRPPGEVTAKGTSSARGPIPF